MVEGVVQIEVNLFAGLGIGEKAGGGGAGVDTGELDVFLEAVHSIKLLFLT